jgi:hypothetical protein
MSGAFGSATTLATEPSIDAGVRIKEALRILSKKDL